MNSLPLPIKISRLGALAMGLAVMMGAFGAHALKGQLDPYSLDIYQKAALYQFIHGIALLLIGIFIRVEMLTQPIAAKIAVLFSLGIVLFCGSLFVLAISGERWLGAITPFGGVCFIVAWIWLAYSLAQRAKP